MLSLGIGNTYYLWQYSFCGIFQHLKQLIHSHGEALMATRKTSTSKKRVAKKTVTRKAKSPAVKKAASPVAEIEKSIAKSQAQLAGLYSKAATQAQKNADRIKGQLDKAVARQTVLRDKKNAAAEKVSTNRTPAALKQLARARDTLKIAGQKTAELRAQIKVAKAALKEAADAQKKSVAQQKAMDKFASDWAKANQPKKRKAPAKRRAKKTVAAAPAATEPSAS
jgi:hypothetical protein